MIKFNPMKNLRFTLDDETHEELRIMCLKRKLKVPQALEAAVRMLLSVPLDKPLPGEEECRLKK